MTFLNPFVLFGLAAAAIPILIHLLNKRKLRTIEFSTLTFLKELQKNTMRKITIRQWLLLLLRTLVVIFLVLAFSRPALKGDFGIIGSHAKTSLLIILDNTASMELHNEKGTYLDQAKEQALQIVSMMEENDDAIVIRLSDLPSLTMESASHDRQKLQSLIQGTSVSIVHRTIDEALRSGSELLQRSKNINKEVYILSDGQMSTLHSEVKKKKDDAPVFDQNVKFFYSQFNSMPHNNIGIERISIPPTLLQRNKPVVVTAVVKNYGSSRVENHLVSMSIGTARVMQKNISLQGGETGTLEFTYTPTRTGFITGSIRLEDDEFEPDNVRYFSLPIPDNISVTLVSTDEQHARFISTALNTVNTLSSPSFITLHRLSPAHLSTTAARASDVIILSGIKNVSDQQRLLFASYVNDGGSILFFPSTDSLFSRYSYLAQFGISEFRMSVMKPPGTQFGAIDIQFPIFTGMFDPLQSKNQTVESPDVVRSLVVALTPAVRPIISLSNDVPFLWMTEHGKGRMLGFSVPATTGWSNFPLKGIFVPLINQSVIYLASQLQLEVDARAYNAGDNLEFSSRQIRKSVKTSPTNLKMIDPENRVSPVQTRSKMSANGTTQTIYTGEQLFNLGHHYVIADRETVFTFPVNLDSHESETKLAGHNDVISSFGTCGVPPDAISIIEPGSSLQETVLQSRFGVELWKYFMVLAVVCAVIEMIVAREKKGS